MHCQFLTNETQFFQYNIIERGIVHQIMNKVVEFLEKI